MGENEGGSTERLMLYSGYQPSVLLTDEARLGHIPLLLRFVSATSSHSGSSIGSFRTKFPERVADRLTLETGVSGCIYSLGGYL